MSAPIVYLSEKRLEKTFETLESGIADLDHHIADVIYMAAQLTKDLIVLQDSYLVPEAKPSLISVTN